MVSAKKPDAKLIAQEMLPFAIYTAIPLIIIILIAFSMGATR